MTLIDDGYLDSPDPPRRSPFRGCLALVAIAKLPRYIAAVVLLVGPWVIVVWAVLR